MLFQPEFSVTRMFVFLFFLHESGLFPCPSVYSVVQLPCIRCCLVEHSFKYHRVKLPQTINYFSSFCSGAIITNAHWNILFIRNYRFSKVNFRASHQAKTPNFQSKRADVIHWPTIKTETFSGAFCHIFLPLKNVAFNMISQ